MVRHPSEEDEGATWQGEEEQGICLCRNPEQDGEPRREVELWIPRALE